jgi:hypothetical protein
MFSMTAEARCLQLIEKVRDAADDPAAAYLIRSRLRRAILSCARMVADKHGAPKPEVPGVFAAPASATEVDHQVVTICNRIYGIAHELCQPSESFDLRWQEGWAALQLELNRLEVMLLLSRNRNRHTLSME